LFIREVTGPHWMNSFIITMAYELLPEFESIQTGSLEKTNQIVHKYNVLVNRIFEFGLQECFGDKHILNGSEIMNLLGIKKGGVRVKQMLELVMEWQLENPDGSVEQCKEYIKNKYDETEKQ
ncbi:1959_t:CDS:2, partial [Acaulospora morrowiae]